MYIFVVVLALFFSVLSHLVIFLFQKKSERDLQFFVKAMKELVEDVNKIHELVCDVAKIEEVVLQKFGEWHHTFSSQPVKLVAQDLPRVNDEGLRPRGANRNPRTEEQKRLASEKRKSWWAKKRAEEAQAKARAFEHQTSAFVIDSSSHLT